ncbi:MAG: FAD:protein FMN transferase [Planctomycetia bacterium]
MSGPADGRRGFLDPRGLLRSVGDLQGKLGSAADEIQAWASSPIVCFRRSAMACMFEIQLPGGEADRPGARAAVQAAFDEIDRLEQLLTVYRDDGDTALMNDRAPLGPTSVDPRLFQLLLDCHRWGRELGGAFDVTAGPLVRVWGFKRRQGRVPDDDEIALALSRVGMDKVWLDGERGTVAYKTPGMEINFGAVGKGYALDRAAAVLRMAGVRAALLGAGRSSILAVGRPPWDDAWQIDLADPRVDASADLDEPPPRLAAVQLVDAAASTSGVAEQSFTAEGRRYGHLLDPRTGRPVERLLQTTAVAPTAAEAEALSTGFFVLGPDESARRLRQRTDAGTLFVRTPAADRPAVTAFGGIVLRDAAFPLGDFKARAEEPRPR